jgi:hypothetical protein
MRLAVLFTMFLILTAACAPMPVTKEETAGLDYGPKPVRWREQIRSYLDIRLTNPKEALVEYRSEPKQLFQRDTALRERQYGWATCVWVNDKSREGKFEGFYPMTFFIRDEKIVAVNNGPDDFGIIGSRYAREQCELLGSRFTG